MRIAINARLLLSHRLEGVARYILETTKEMVLSHPEHEFHLYFDRPFQGDLIESSNLHLHVIRPQARHPILWYIWFEWSLERAMKKDKIDVLFSGESYLSLRSKIPVVMVSHDINYFHYPSHIRKSHLKYFRTNFPKFHRKANHIIAVSEFTKQDIVKAYDIDANKVTVAYNAAPEGFKPLSKEEKKEIKNKFCDGKDFFIYVGSLHPRKNVGLLIKSFSEYKSEYNSENKLVIYGRAAFLTDKIEKAYELSNWKDDIIFLGNDDIAVQKILATSVALCYISLFEGFGIPILEAFSCGIPVITSNVSSMPEVAGDAAILVSPESIKEISEAMHSIQIDANLRESLIEKGFERTEDFSWKTSAQTIMNALIQVNKLN